MTIPDKTEAEKGTGEETSAASSTENKSEEQAGDSSTTDKNATDAGKEKDVPFHDHPRWKEREEQWNKRLEEQREEFDKKLAALDPKNKPEDEKNGSDVIPEWFGGDLKQWKAYQADQRKLLADSRKEWEQELKNTHSAQEKAVVEANKHFDESVLKIEAASGQKVDRKELLQFVIDNQIVDLKTQKWDYEKGYRWMTAEKKANGSSNQGGGRQARKDLAGATTTDAGKGEKETSTVKTSDDFKNPAERPW